MSVFISFGEGRSLDFSFARRRIASMSISLMVGSLRRNSSPANVVNEPRDERHRAAISEQQAQIAVDAGRWSCHPCPKKHPGNESHVRPCDFVSRCHLLGSFGGNSTGMHPSGY